MYHEKKPRPGCWFFSKQRNVCSSSKVIVILLETTWFCQHFVLRSALSICYDVYLTDDKRSQTNTEFFGSSAAWDYQYFLRSFLYCMSSHHFSPSVSCFSYDNKASSNDFIITATSEHQLSFSYNVAGHFFMSNSFMGYCNNPSNKPIVTIATHI